MTRLSVNLNKVALLRNQRDVGVPNLVHAAEISIDAGASGITVHPRPDERHTRVSDVHDLSAFTTERGVEFNIEGIQLKSFLNWCTRSCQRSARSYQTHLISVRQIMVGISVLMAHGYAPLLLIFVIGVYGYRCSWIQIPQL